MMAYPILLISRHDPLRYLFEKPVLVGRCVKWQILLAEFDITFVQQKSVKAQAMADHLAELPLKDHQPLTTEFPDEHVNLNREEMDRSECDRSEHKLYFDGAVNRRGYGIGFVLEDPHGRQLPVSKRLGFECSNNMAEYEACIGGLRLALESGVRRLQVFGDSLLVISQVNGDWKTKDVKLIPYHDCLQQLISHFDYIKFAFMNRKRNAYADALATLASWIEVPYGHQEEITVSTTERPAYYLVIEEEPRDGLPWFYDIQNYLEHGMFPPEATTNDRRMLTKIASRYVMGGGQLYRRSYNQLLLRCVDQQEAGVLMLQVHAGSCGPHMNGILLAKKIMLQGYFWSTMEADYC
jgi:ribonuclease HI